MTNSKTTKRALLTSVLALIVCFVMLLGTTFAWFTDSVTSGNNKIMSGTLDMKVSFSDKIDGTYQDVEKAGAIFDYDLWEPGYTEVKYVKIENAGNLAFRYDVDIVPMVATPEGEVNLADVIDVYLIEDPQTGIAGRTDLANLTPAGVLSDIIGTGAGATAGHGVLLPKGEEKDGFYTESITLAIALKMQESAGNEYQGLTVGDGFDLRFYATQYTYEEDSFDNRYDAAAEYDKLPTATVTKLATPPTVDYVDLETGNTLGATQLNVGYVFETTETYSEAQENPYAKWHADYVVTFDKAVKKGTAGLGGQYDTWSADWLAFVTPFDIEAGQAVRLLDTAGITMNYEELCLLVEKFQCGAFDINGQNAGTTMTVELRLYETKDPADTATNTQNEETGKYTVVSTHSYTFPERGIPSDLPTAEVTHTEEEVTVDIYGFDFKDTGINAEIGEYWTFTAEDYATAQNSPYADWKADYVISFNKDVKAESAGLAGNYGSYGWLGFVTPTDIAAGEEIALLGTVLPSFDNTYENICLAVQEFKCSAFALDESVTGTTMTVELRLTNPADSSDYYVVNSIDYIF